MNSKDFRKKIKQLKIDDELRFAGLDSSFSFIFLSDYTDDYFYKYNIEGFKLEKELKNFNNLHLGDTIINLDKKFLSLDYLEINLINFEESHISNLIRSDNCLEYSNFIDETNYILYQENNYKCYIYDLDSRKIIYDFIIETKWNKFIKINSSIYKNNKIICSASCTGWGFIIFIDVKNKNIEIYEEPKYIWDIMSFDKDKIIGIKAIEESYNYSQIFLFDVNKRKFSNLLEQQFRVSNIYFYSEKEILFFEGKKIVVFNLENRNKNYIDFSEHISLELIFPREKYLNKFMVHDRSKNYLYFYEIQK